MAMRNGPRVHIPAFDKEEVQAVEAAPTDASAWVDFRTSYVRAGGVIQPSAIRNARYPMTDFYNTLRFYFNVLPGSVGGLDDLTTLGLTVWGMNAEEVPVPIGSVTWSGDGAQGAVMPHVDVAISPGDVYFVTVSAEESEGTFDADLQVHIQGIYKDTRDLP